MKLSLLLFITIMLTITCFGQQNTSAKTFNDIVLVNKIEFINPAFDQPKFSCGFLLKYKDDTFAVTAKHIIKIIKPDGMTTLSFENNVKSWSLYSLDNRTGLVTCDKLLNENNAESLDAKSTYHNDWLIFSIKQNSSAVKPLQTRTTPLVPGEKLYVAGWTRTMESGAQRVYEFEYYKTIGNRILLKDIIVPEKFGGLSGAPLVDENGLLAGIVSNGTVDPDTNRKYFSPCSVTTLSAFLENIKAGK
ncbi:MAG: trypsin-like serine protease [Ferruginibacter sp.]